MTALATALRLQPGQAATMMAAFPPLAQYSPATLAGKVGYLADLLRLRPDEVSHMAWRCPRLLGVSLGKLEGRLLLLEDLLGGRPHLLQVCCCTGLEC